MAGRVEEAAAAQKIIFNWAELHTGVIYHKTI